MPKLIFADTETTGLDHQRHEMWEFAAITYDPDGEAPPQRHHYFVYPNDLGTADPNALRINRFYERTADLQSEHSHGGLYDATHTIIDNAWSERRGVAMRLARLFDNATLFANNPSFDELMVTKFLNFYSQQYVGLHRKHNVSDIAHGWLSFQLHQLRLQESEGVQRIRDALALPVSSRALLDAAGCPPNLREHTAMGDAEHVYDAARYLLPHLQLPELPSKHSQPSNDVPF